MTEAEIAQLSPDVRRDLDEHILGWRGMTPDQVQDALVEYREGLMVKADALLDLYNNLAR